MVDGHYERCSLTMFDALEKFNHLFITLRLKLYDVLDILHILRNAINIVWKRDIMSCFTKLSLINNMRKIKEKIEIR